MPPVDQLMQEWPTGFEDLLKDVSMSHWDYCYHWHHPPSLLSLNFSADV